MKAWQPIETAPKDGGGIMLTNGVTVAQGQWLHQEPVFRERRDLSGRYIDQDEFEGFDGWVDWAGGMNPGPTHWMPLPEPPGADRCCEGDCTYYGQKKPSTCACSKVPV